LFYTAASQKAGNPITCNFMRKPIIHEEDPNLEYNLWGSNYLKYKGELFTGTLIFDDTNPISYTEYKNGDYDGENVSYHKNGKLAEKAIYKDGDYIEGQEWHPNGQIKFDSTEGKQWDLNGKLIQVNGIWLYNNGNPKQKRIENGCLYLSPNGDTLFKVLYNTSGDFKNSVEYYDENLHNCYNQLLLNEYGDLDSLFYNTEWYFWGWIWRLYSEDENKTFTILTDLKKHINNSVSKKASELIIKMRENAQKNTWKEYGGYHIKNNG
jgi:antitoxin component YwqK of YwqJK toxin-antitoxin module